MHQQMPESMVNARIEIIQHLTQGKNISQVAQITGHGRNLVRQIKKQIENQQDIFAMDKKLGAPKKRTDDVENEIIRLKMADSSLGLTRIASCISENPGYPSISPSLVRNVLNDNGFMNYNLENDS